MRETGAGTRGKPIYETFTPGPFMAALDLIEFDDSRSVDSVLEQLRVTRGRFGKRGAPAHPGHIAWVAEAVERYLDSRAADEAARAASGAPPTYPVRHEWIVRDELTVADRRGALIYERTAWGRRYATADGSLRELRLLSVGDSKEDRPASEKAAAAYIVAFGLPAYNEWGKAYLPVPDLPAQATRVPDRVRVLDFGCGDDTATELVDCTPEQARDAFAEHAVPVLAESVDGDGKSPGSACVDCKALAGCAELPRTPVLLGVPAPPRRRRRRSVSASDLRTHAECPTKFHLTRVLHVRSPRPENDAIQRGRAVDAWLNQWHLVRHPRGCRDVELPPDGEELTVGALHLVGAPARTAARMIAEHRTLCPLDGLAGREVVEVQKQVTAYDPELDAVIIAKPDLLYTRDGGWIWRETKTAAHYLYEGKPLLGSYPQLALAVLLMAAGVLGGDSTRARIELEILYPDDSSLEEIDPGRDSVVEEARAAVRELAAPWAGDETHEPRVGRQCSHCEVVEWCSAGREHIAAGGVEAPRGSS
ncbi:PD-(D/E)XK nuclease family protein [Streptomyces sp. SID3343]|uniref:PD-(D/E)XK nuclease family protein n=1 Tax=Streptomyces sp. SID3343 TaxID=2690260 RepID=UPI0031FA3CBF